jgi:type IV pilus assembly protein PilC
LSLSLEDYPEAFDPVFISLVRAGEGSGQLTDILAAQAESLKWEDELAVATRRGLIYPGIVAAIALLAAVFLMIYLVPQLKLFVHNMGQTLPWHARALFLISGLLGEHWPWLFAIALIVPIAARLILTRSLTARQWFDRLKLRLPIVGNLLGKIVLSRFAATFAMLYAAGIPVLEAIRQSQDFAGNHAIRQALEAVEQNISAGSPIAGAFGATGIFPPLVVRMLRIGETTGSLDTALRNVSYFYSREVRESAARVQAIIEPALTLFMGLLLGWIMLSVIGPIYDVISRIKA